MAKAQRKNTGDFEAILAGLAEQAAQERHGGALRQPEPKAQGRAQYAATGAESPVRRILKNISFPWPANISARVRSLGWRPQRAYDEIAAEGEQVAKASPPESDAPAKSGPPKPANAEDEGIAAELGLHPELQPADLRRIRRDFAEKNHPDRFGPAHRTGAARRMSIANMLIDELMRQSRPPR